MAKNGRHDFPMLGRNPERRICWKCGLAEGEKDLAGCTMDVLSAHDFREPASRPYGAWDFEELTARYGRAQLKAKSALAAADHFGSCPNAGPDAFVTLLYRQKAMKRTRLADLLWQEIARRVDGAAREVMEEMPED